jgi:hypothetical protein
MGFYLIFDANAEFIYTGKGYGDTRVQIHFNMTSEEEYFEDACFWLWFRVDNEDEALAYEKAVYDVYVEEMKKPPKHNTKAPEGSHRFNAQEKSYCNLLANNDWKGFLSNIREQYLFSKNY